MAKTSKRDVVEIELHIAHLEALKKLNDLPVEITRVTLAAMAEPIIKREGVGHTLSDNIEAAVRMVVGAEMIWDEGPNGGRTNIRVRLS